MMRKTTMLEATALAAALLAAPALLHAETLVISGGTIHPISGEAFEGSVVVQDGVIVSAGPGAPAPGGDATVIDATGKHVYPGIFDALSRLGLLEIGSVPATDDRAEMRIYNPHLKAATAIHPASEVIPVSRANGITHSMVAPASDDGVVAGQAALVHLDGWTVEEMAMDDSVAMVITWPEIQTRSFDFATFSVKETPFAEAKEKAEEQIAELRDWFDAARHYAQAQAAGSERLERDLKLEALAKTLDGGMPVVVAAFNKRDIEAAVKFAEEYGLAMILAGGRDAWKVKEMLAEKGIPVILSLTQSLPREEDDPYDKPYAVPGELAAAGVKIAFASGTGGGFGPGGPHGSRTVPYEAAQAVPFGLSEEEALRALTLYPAEMLGMDDKLGTIEPGRIANLIVTDGSPLEITTQVHHVVIAGREVSTDNRHRELYERYRSRPAR